MAPASVQSELDMRTSRQRLVDFVQLMERYSIAPQPLYRIAREEAVQQRRTRGLFRNPQPQVIRHHLEVAAKGWVYTTKSISESTDTGMGISITPDGLLHRFRDHRASPKWSNAEHLYAGRLDVDPSWPGTSNPEFVPVATGGPVAARDQFKGDRGYADLLALAAYYTGRAAARPLITYSWYG